MTAVSLDLNIVENVSSYVVRKAHKKGKQYNFFKDLEDNMYLECNSIDPEFLKQFIASVLDRMAKCMTMKRGSINY